MIYSPNEIAARGREIYERDLRARLEPQNDGKYLVIDIVPGEYEMDADGEATSLRARDKNPDGVRYGMRIGQRAWGKIGSGVTRAAQ